MKSVNVLIKPVSSICNMNCNYCFYHSIISKSEIKLDGVMSLELLEKIVVSAIEYADLEVCFAFQGGEPTLAGLAFFEKLIEFEKTHNKKHLKIHNAIQTNAYDVDEDFIIFLKNNDFLVGVSLDGPAEIHDFERIDLQGKGTFNKVMHTIGLLNKHGVKYNILSVVTGRNAKHIKKIYTFFKMHDFKYLQFIPCLEPLENTRGNEKYHLSIDRYKNFLIDIFDLWFDDLKRGDYRSVRHIDNWMAIHMGLPAEACNSNGICSIQNVVEVDGSVYPCDFYVYAENQIGTIGKSTLGDMSKSEPAKKFIRESFFLPDKCAECKYLSICRNGCKRDRLTSTPAVKSSANNCNPVAKPECHAGKADDIFNCHHNSKDEKMELNYYCDAYFAFFSERERQLQEAKILLTQGFIRQ